MNRPVLPVIDIERGDGNTIADEMGDSLDVSQVYVPRSGTAACCWYKKKSPRSGLFSCGVIHAPLNARPAVTASLYGYLSFVSL